MDISPEILQFVTNFGALGMSLLWLWDMRQKVKDKESEIRLLRDELKQARDAHQDDLRDWSGIDPRFKTWSRPPPESDTNLRLTMQDREQMNERISKLKPPE
jgi:hypothetical protein